jgi:ABC-type nitrate/sulfonate/bicarbonate transport system substrate-binding protein
LSALLESFLTFFSSSSLLLCFQMLLRFSLFIFLLEFLVVSQTSLPSHCPDGFLTITLQLKWFLQAQFSGFVAADQKGFYQDECLVVSLRPGGPNINPEVEVLQNKAQFGTNWLSAGLVGRAETQATTFIAQVSVHFLSLAVFAHILLLFSIFHDKVSCKLPSNHL